MLAADLGWEARLLMPGAELDAGRGQAAGCEWTMTYCTCRMPSMVFAAELYSVRYSITPPPALPASPRSRPPPRLSQIYGRSPSHRRQYIMTDGWAVQSTPASPRLVRRFRHARTPYSNFGNWRLSGVPFPTPESASPHQSLHRITASPYRRISSFRHRVRQRWALARWPRRRTV